MSTYQALGVMLDLLQFIATLLIAFILAKKK